MCGLYPVDVDLRPFELNVQNSGRNNFHWSYNVTTIIRPSSRNLVGLKPAVVEWVKHGQIRPAHKNLQIGKVLDEKIFHVSIFFYLLKKRKTFIRNK